MSALCVMPMKDRTTPNRRVCRAEHVGLVKALSQAASSVEMTRSAIPVVQMRSASGEIASALCAASMKDRTTPNLRACRAEHVGLAKVSSQAASLVEMTRSAMPVVQMRSASEEKMSALCAAPMKDRTTPNHRACRAKHVDLVKVLSQAASSVEMTRSVKSVVETRSASEGKTRA